MGLKRIDERLSRVTTIINGWQNNKNVPRIERDLALEELRHIYDEILDYTPEEGDDEEQPSHSTTVVATTEVINDIVDDFDDALDIDALLGLTDDEPEPVAEQEPITESEPITELEPIAEPEPIIESEPIAEPEVVPAPNPGGGLFAIEDIPVRSKSSRKMINLYNTSSTPAPVRKPMPAPQPELQPEPVSVQSAPQPQQSPLVEPMPVAAQPLVAESPAPQRLGDVLGSGRKVVGDVQLQDNAPIAPMNKIADLRNAIGLNDKFLLLRDLFNGDVPLYERTIDTLNAFEDLDECMIYIVENFRWNPDLEASKLLVSLIERKLA